MSGTGYVPPRQPMRCGSCGAEWFTTHTCPNAPRGTSGPFVVLQSTVTFEGSPRPTNLEVAKLHAENVVLRDALQAVWDDLEDLMVFDTVRQQVKNALGIREFEAAPLLTAVPDEESASHSEHGGAS